MAEQGITKQRLISELSKSAHGSLKEYLTIGKQGVQQEGEFYQHLISWDRRHGQIRDSKVALPVIGLAFEKDEELDELAGVPELPIPGGVSPPRDDHNEPRSSLPASQERELEMDHMLEPTIPAIPQRISPGLIPDSGSEDELAA